MPGLFQGREEQPAPVERPSGASARTSHLARAEVNEVLHAYLYDPTRPGQGGGVSYVDRIVRWLVSQGIRTVVLGVQTADRRNTHTRDLEFVPVRRPHGGIGFWWLFWLKLFLMLPFLRLSENAVVHVQRSYFLLPFVLLKPRNPRVCTLHAQPWEWLDVNHPRWRRLFVLPRRLVEAYCLRRAHSIIAISEHVRRGYVREYPWLEGRMHLLPTPVDRGMFKPQDAAEARASLGLGSTEKVVLYVGRLAKQKDVPLLVQAFAIVEQQLPTASLLICGSGPELPVIQKAIREYGVKNVSFLNERPFAEMPQLMSAADVFALSSVFEGSPSVLREALACGTPVVGPAVGDLPAVISNPQVGCVTDRTPEALARGILETLALERDQSAEACRRASADFDHTAAMQEIMGIYGQASRRRDLRAAL